MRERIGDRDLEYSWFPTVGYIINARGNGTPERPFVDAAGVHRLSWEIFVPAVANGQQADWHDSYGIDYPPGTILLRLFRWDRSIDDPPAPAFTAGNLAISDIRVWGGFPGVVTSAPQPTSPGNGQVELSFHVSPNIDNDPNQFDAVWKYKGAILDANSWNRYDGNNINSLPFLLGERGKGLFFSVHNLTGNAVTAGRLRVSVLAYEI